MRICRRRRQHRGQAKRLSAISAETSRRVRKSETRQICCRHARVLSSWSKVLTNNSNNESMVQTARQRRGPHNQISLHKGRHVHSPALQVAPIFPPHIQFKLILLSSS